jgi:hypothetical protein
VVVPAVVGGTLVVEVVVVPLWGAVVPVAV